MKNKILTGFLIAFLSVGYGFAQNPTQNQATSVKTQEKEAKLPTTSKPSRSSHIGVGKTLLITVALVAAVYGLDYALQFIQENGIPKVYDYGIFVSKVNELSIYFTATIAPATLKMLQEITEESKKLPGIFHSALTGILAKNALLTIYETATNNTAAKKIKSVCEYGINKIINLFYDIA